jgi:hypothetical protein
MVLEDYDDGGPTFDDVNPEYDEFPATIPFVPAAQPASDGNGNGMIQDLLREIADSAEEGV